MLIEANVISFLEITKPEVSHRFYEGILGLRLLEDELYALVLDSNRTMLRVSKVSKFTPQPFTVLGWEVTNIEREVEELSARGVVIERYEGFELTIAGS